MSPCISPSSFPKQRGHTVNVSHIECCYSAQIIFLCPLTERNYKYNLLADFSPVILYQHE